MTAEVMRPPGGDRPFRVTGPEILTPPATYSHPLQERIAAEWRPILLENGEGCPSRRLEVFKETLDKFGNLVGKLGSSQLDGDMDLDTASEVARRASYLKVAAIDVSTSMKIDVGSFAEDKTMETMQRKYPADSVYGLVRSGVPSLEAMALHKKAYAEGRAIIPIGYQMIDEELSYRLPRRPAFQDALQDVADTWQRRAFGVHLRASDRLPNIFGEAQEFIEEFEGMTDKQINELARNNRIIKAPSKNDGNLVFLDPVTKKLISIGGEAGDVVIGVDGFVSGLDRDQQIDSKAALDRQIFRYKKTKKLVKLGYTESEAMRLQHEVDNRKRRGLSLPFINIPAAATLLLG